MAKPKLLMIIPCYKEAKNLSGNLPKVCKYITSHKIACDLLVVEGEKLDNTADIVRRNQKQYKFLKFTSTHKGKGHQVKTGLKFGSYDQYLFMDADLATPLKYIPTFLAIAQKDNPAMITGVRVRRHGNLLRKSISTILNYWLQIGLGFRQTDTQCGFKLLSRELRNIVLKKQVSQNWVFDVEYFIMAYQNKLKVVSVPIPEWKNDYDRATLNTAPKFLKSSFSSGIELMAIMWRSWTGWYKS
jgi:glycosyltransferase involved in cell wall biosynthesis